MQEFQFFTKSRHIFSGEPIGTIVLIEYSRVFANPIFCAQEDLANWLRFSIAKSQRLHETQSNKER